MTEIINLVDLEILFMSSNVFGVVGLEVYFFLSSEEHAFKK